MRLSLLIFHYPQSSFRVMRDTGPATVRILRSHLGIAMQCCVVYGSLKVVVIVSTRLA